jgi:hypothetical protein
MQYGLETNCLTEAVSQNILGPERPASGGPECPWPLKIYCLDSLHLIDSIQNPSSIVSLVRNFEFNVRKMHTY